MLSPLVFVPLIVIRKEQSTSLPQMILESSELGGQLGSIQAGLSWQSWAGPQADTQGGGQGRKAKREWRMSPARPGQEPGS